MSESENIAAAAPWPGSRSARWTPKTGCARNSSTRCSTRSRPATTTPRAQLVEPLHPADVADLIELAARDEREGLVKALAGIVDADVLAEMNEHVREALLDALEPEQVADLAGQMETDDAVAILEDLEEDEQRAVLQAMEPDDRAAIEEALTYPEESAGRLMQRDLIAVPEHWKVGQVIDYLRSTDELADDFWEVFVVNPSHHPVGTCKLSSILRSPRSSPVARHHDGRADADPGRHGPGGCRAALPEICAWSRPRWSTATGRLVGMITVDDIVHIIQEEAGEDVLLLSGAGEGDINEPVSESYPHAGALADRQSADRAGRGLGDPPVRSAASSGSRSSPC